MVICRPGWMASLRPAGLGNLPRDGDLAAARARRAQKIAAPGRRAEQDADQFPNPTGEIRERQVVVHHGDPLMNPAHAT